MATSRDKYYTEMCRILTDYNGHKNTPLPNANIQEAIHKFIEDELIADANIVTADTFSNV